MELKTNDITKSDFNVSNNHQDNMQSNPNDALFGNLDNLDTAYVVTNTAVSKKPKNIIPIIGTIVCAVGIIAIFVFANMKGHKYDGTYRLTKISAMGIDYSMEYFTELTGAEIYIQLKLKGDKCTANMSGFGQEMSGTETIEWEGNKFAITSGGEILYCEYDEERDAFVIAQGGNALILERVD